MGNFIMNKWHTDIGFHIPKLSLLEVWPLNTFIGNKNNLTVIDVGGNVGLWCQAFMNTFGKQVDQYHAFEPLDGNLKIFRSRLSDKMVPYGNKVIIHQSCIGPCDGTVEVRFHKDVSAFASVVIKEAEVGNKIILNDKTKRIKQMSLDSFCSLSKLEKVDLIKIDVEGYEWDVFDGAKSLLESKKIDMILFEFGQYQENLHQSFKQFWELLTNSGYHIYRQAVDRNFFGMQHISSYDESLEKFDSMWMVLASMHMHDEKMNSPFVIGKYPQSKRKTSKHAILIPFIKWLSKKLSG